MKELVIKVDGQKAITKDNVTVDLDGVLYIKVCFVRKNQAMTKFFRFKTRIKHPMELMMQKTL